LATKFARARVKSKLTQEQLAKSTGLSLATIFRYETGRASDPRLRILVRVAIALDVPLEDICEDHWLEWGRSPAPPYPPDDTVVFRLSSGGS
jgi:transcriptional regulator with XRE-family HTH domain